jgi:hypothetical protein
VAFERDKFNRFTQWLKSISRTPRIELRCNWGKIPASISTSRWTRFSKMHFISGIIFLFFLCVMLCIFVAKKGG